MKAVLVYWADSTGVPGWTEPDPIDIGEIVTLGWLVWENDESIGVSASHGNDDTVESPLAIPWSAITRFYEVSGL